MNFIRLLPVKLSILVLAAHFLREGLLLLVIGLLLSLLLLFVKRPFVPLFFQGVLLLGAVEWGRTTLNLIYQRQLLHDDFGRLAGIMAGVIIFTLASALIFQARPLRIRYGRLPQSNPLKTNQSESIHNA